MPLPSGADSKDAQLALQRSVATAMSMGLPPNARPYSTSTLFGPVESGDGLADLAVQPEHHHRARRSLHLVRADDQAARRVRRVDPDRGIVGIVRDAVGPDRRAGYRPARSASGANAASDHDQRRSRSRIRNSIASQAASAATCLCRWYDSGPCYDAKGRRRSERRAGIAGLRAVEHVERLDAEDHSLRLGNSMSSSGARNPPAPARGQPRSIVRHCPTSHSPESRTPPGSATGRMSARRADRSDTPGTMFGRWSDVLPSGPRWRCREMVTVSMRPVRAVQIPLDLPAAQDLRSEAGVQVPLAGPERKLRRPSCW